LTGVAVAFVGIISFVGLVVPHLMRMLLGPAHRALLVSSAFGGALLIVVADLLARTLIGGAELPIGLLTSLVGGPFFFVLLWRQRRASGGRSEEHTSELQSRENLVCRLLLEKKKRNNKNTKM